MLHVPGAIFVLVLGARCRSGRERSFPEVGVLFRLAFALIVGTPAWIWLVEPWLRMHMPGLLWTSRPGSYKSAGIWLWAIVMYLVADITARVLDRLLSRRG